LPNDLLDDLARCSSHRSGVRYCLGGVMETLQLEATIGPDGMLRIEAPTHQQPGPANVVVVISPVTESPKTFRWRDLAGVGSEIWQGEDAQAYVNRLRDE
jgi:hypothetical protein